MSKPLRRKLESAVVNYLKAADPARASRYIGGHSTDQPVAPYVAIYAASAGAAGDMPEETGIRLVTLVAHCKNSADAPAAGAGADAMLEQVEDLLLAPANPNAAHSDDNPQCGALLAALNKPESGPDTRPVKGLHIYDIYETEDSDGFEDAHWLDQRTFAVVCQPFDSH